MDMRKSRLKGGFVKISKAKKWAVLPCDSKERIDALFALPLVSSGIAGERE
jgi:hypothetical protein